MKKEKLVILDSHALIHRAYHAVPPLTSPKGENVGAVYGFASILMRVIKELKPDYILAAFDSAGPTFRHKEFEMYKANRPEVDIDLVNQFDLVKEIVTAFGIPVLAKTGFEADDIVGTVVERLKNKKDLEKIIVTGDMDTLQLIDNDTIKVYTLRKGVTDTVIYDEASVKERFEGLMPDQMIDYKGLKGDPSDNIPGVPGVGEKTAISLLQNYKNLEELYQNLDKDKKIKPPLKEKLAKFKNQAFLSRQLATISRDAPVEFGLKESKLVIDAEKVKNVFNRFGFRSLVNRLDGLLGKVESVSEVQGQLLASVEDDLKDYLDRKIFSQKIYELEKKLTPVLRKIEQRGFLVDIKVLNNLSRKIAQELVQIKIKVKELSGEDFNLNSTQELGRIIFEKLNLGVGSKIKKTKKGAFSTAFEELEKLKGAHPIIPLMLRWRELSKLQSTYVEALPRLVSPADGRIHTSFKQLGAVTGRLASENPNLQNIPTKGAYGTEIRTAFVAPPGFLILAVDYSQIELRVAAAMSGDEKMIETFKRGEDIHTRTAAEVFNVEPAEVTKEMRREAKSLNFGILYGMGPKSFAQSTGLGLAEAKEFFQKYRDNFPGLILFMEDMKRLGRSRGYVETLWGRRRYLDDLKSPNPMLRASAERMAINMPVQGTATGDVVKAAMVELDGQFSQADDIAMIFQVHDEIVFEVKNASVNKYAPVIKKIMENIIDLPVPLVVEMEVGPNWGELKKL